MVVRVLPCCGRVWPCRGRAPRPCRSPNCRVATLRAPARVPAACPRAPNASCPPSACVPAPRSPAPRAPARPAWPCRGHSDCIAIQPMPFLAPMSQYSLYCNTNFLTGSLPLLQYNFSLAIQFFFFTIQLGSSQTDSAAIFFHYFYFYFSFVTGTGK